MIKKPPTGVMVPKTEVARQATDALGGYAYQLDHTVFKNSLFVLFIDPNSPDYVSPEQYQAMIGWVAGPKRAIEIGTSDMMNLDRVVEQYAPDLLHISLSSLDHLPKQELLQVQMLSLISGFLFFRIYSKIEEILMTKRLTSRQLHLLSKKIRTRRLPMPWKFE